MQNNPIATAKGAALGLALLESVAAQAGTAKLEGVRIIPGTVPQTGSDAFQRGRGLLVLGDVPAALAAFRQAMLSDPQSTAALNGIAVCYDRLGRYDISRSYYEAALAIDPNSAVILNNFGYSLYLQGDYQTAITHLQAAEDSGDADVSAASRRTLALIAAQPHNADADTATVQLQPTPVAAHIERTSGSEVRLVLGDSPRTAPVRIARAANQLASLRAVVPGPPALRVPATMVATTTVAFAPAARPTPPQALRPVAAVQIAAIAVSIDHAAIAASDTLVPVAPIVVALDTEAAATTDTEVAAVTDAEIAAATAISPAWTPQDDARLVAEQQALDRAALTTAVPAIPAPAVPGRRTEDAVVWMAAAGFSSPQLATLSVTFQSPLAAALPSLSQARAVGRGSRPAVASPWIVTALASPRVRLPVAGFPAGPFPPGSPVPGAGAANLASDDADLNDFLARIRQRSMPVRAKPMDVEAAVALLESIIARVRAV